jgi:hypothetical protein
MFVKHLCPPLGIHCRVHKPLLWAVSWYHSVNQISFQYVQSLQRKWTKTANYWNFLSPRGHNSVQNGLIVPKSELGLDIVMVNLYTKFHFNMWILCRENERKLQIIAIFLSPRGITLSKMDWSYPKENLT